VAVLAPLRTVRILLPTVMAGTLCAVMSTVETLVHAGHGEGLVTAWLGSFALGIAVAVPTAVAIGPTAQRLVARLVADDSAQH
jgi:hypothetical protein